MAQVTIYLPDELASQLRKEADRSGKSISSFMAELARRQLQPRGWSKEFVKLAGAGLDGFPDLDDPPPDEVEPL